MYRYCIPYKTKILLSNPHKYMGGTTHVYTKSLWERKFCKYLDETPTVKKWGYEKIKIPYLSPIDKKVHTYYPDFIILTEENGTQQVFIIEVKPNKQTKSPEKKKKASKTYMEAKIQYLVNEAKWNATKVLCEKNNWKFKILTEKTLFNAN